jgi:hypothetical protein
MNASLRCASMPEDPAAPDRAVPDKTANENTRPSRQPSPEPAAPGFVSPYLRQPLRSYAEVEADIANRRRQKPRKPPSPADT